MWLLVKRLLQEGVEEDAVNCAALMSVLIANGWEETLARFLEVNVRFLDDLAKQRTSARIYTANGDGENIEDRLGPNFGPPIIARIRESCHDIPV